MYTAYLLANSGGENPCVDLPAEQVEDFRTRLEKTLAAGSRQDLVLTPRGGFALRWGSDERARHLVVRKGVVAIYNESGGADLFQDVGDIESLLRYCMRDEIARLERVVLDPALASLR